MFQLIPLNDAVSEEDMRYKVVNTETGDAHGDAMTRDEALALKARLVVGEIAEEEKAKAAPKRRRKP